MESQPKQVMQFKVTLLDIEPPVWRRIQVPASYTLWDLHVAIQDAMGWEDYHLHAFEINDPTTGQPKQFGIPSDDDWYKVLTGWEHAISDCFCEGNAAAMYKYDFGDSWNHKIVLENVVPAEDNIRYPRCIAGRRRCPPEDCGGVWGYGEFLEAIGDPQHEEHKRMLEWVGGSFDPDEFDPASVRFDDPGKRWNLAFASEH